MKKLILTFIALSTAGWMTTASAQSGTNTAPDEVNGPPGGPPGMNGNGPGGPPDAGGPPPEMIGQPPPDENGGPGPDNNASSDNSGNGHHANAPLLPTKRFGADQSPVESQFLPPGAPATNFNSLVLNFKNAPLEMVLNYLSDAAGFIIIQDTPVRGNVSVISAHPLTQEEAVDMLNAVLNQNGYAAIRNGRMLTIVDKNDAKTRDIPVKVSNDPDSIPKNDEIVTQVIPIRFVDAGDLVKDLSSFVSPEATVVANDAGNSIVITDTQSNIRHIAEIIKAIDSSAEAETEIRVFPLKFASPTDVANELSNVFPSSTSGNNNQAPIRFGGPGGFFGRMFGGGGRGGGGGNAGGGDSSADRIKKATQVTAVADSRIQAVIVTAPKDLMAEIGEMMTQLDVPSPRDQNVYVFHLRHGDPYEVSQVLQNQFGGSSSSRGGSSSSGMTQSPLQLRQQNTATTTSSSGNTVGSSITGGGSGGGGGGRGGGGF